MIMAFRVVLSFLFLLCSCELCLGKTVIVLTQKKFDNVVDRINSGEELNVKLAKKTFHLNKKINATVPLSFVSNGAIITSHDEVFESKFAEMQTDDHYVFKINNSLSLFPLFYSPSGDIIEVSESVNEKTYVNYIDGIIESNLVYKTGEKISFSIPNNLIHLRDKAFSKTFGYLDCGWTAVFLKIDSTDHDFFYCTTLNDCSTNDYQYDATKYKQKIRFVIYNAEIKPGRIYYDNEYLYVPKDIKKLYCIHRSNIHSRALDIESSSDITLKGVNFIGFKGLDVDSDVNSICEINKCSFRFCLGRALTINKHNGENAKVAKVHCCDFYFCSLVTSYVVQLTSTFNGGSCIKMDECRISRYPNSKVIYKNPVGSVSVNANAQVLNNVIYNSCRDHIFLTKGKIEAKGNFLYNSDAFNNNRDRNFSSDWGMIYCGCIYYDNTAKGLENKSHRIYLQNNLIYGAYAYGENARGIFLDDGRGDVFCENNIILNCQAYSIDARNIKQTDASSVRNVYANNVVTNRYRLEGGPAVVWQNIPQTKANVLLNVRDNLVSNIQVVEKDVCVDVKIDCFLNNGKVLVSDEIYEVFEKNHSWKDLGKYIRRSH